MKLTNSYLFLLFLPFFVIGCDKDDDANGDATINVRLTDAPGEFDAVYIDLQNVEAHVDGTWMPLNVNSGIYDLLQLTNGKDTLIASANIPAGAITQIRLKLGQNNTVVVDSISYGLTTPSAQQSGLKLNVHQTLEPDIGYEFLLDFDAAQSIVLTGNNKYILKPVIKVVANGVDGAIKGSVDPTVQGVPVYAIAGTDTTGTFTAATGEFTIQGLATGSYEVVVAPQPPLKTAIQQNVSVTAGQVTNIGVMDLN